MDIYKEIKCHRCGDKFGRGHVKSCKAMNRMCFSCNKVGHLSSVCRTKTVAAVRTVHVFVRKSAKRQQRDQLRYIEFKRRKLELADLPFNNLSSTEFAEINVMTTCVQPAHKPKQNKVARRIGALKVTISHLQATNKDLSKSLETCQIKNKSIEKKLSDTKFQTTKEIKNLNEENRKIQNKLETERRTFESMESNLRQQMKWKDVEHAKTVASLNDDVYTMERLGEINYESRDRQVKQLQDEVSRLNDTITKLLSEHTKEKLKHEKELKALKASMRTSSVVQHTSNPVNCSKPQSHHRGRVGNRRSIEVLHTKNKQGPISTSMF